MPSSRLYHSSAKREDSALFGIDLKPNLNKTISYLKIPNTSPKRAIFGRVNSIAREARTTLKFHCSDGSSSRNVNFETSSSDSAWKAAIKMRQKMLNFYDSLAFLKGSAMIFKRKLWKTSEAHLVWENHVLSSKKLCFSSENVKMPIFNDFHCNFVNKAQFLSDITSKSFHAS